MFHIKANSDVFGYTTAQESLKNNEIDIYIN